MQKLLDVALQKLNKINNDKQKVVLSRNICPLTHPFVDI